MTSEEIKDRKREPSTLTEEWIREIAYQFAVSNELRETAIKARMALADAINKQEGQKR